MDSIWQVGEAFGALGSMEAMDILPPIAGGVAAIGVTLLCRKFGRSKPNVMKYAPLIGAGAGVLVSLPLYYWRGQPAFVSSAVTAAVVGGGLFAYEKLSSTQWAMGLIQTKVMPRRAALKGHHVQKVSGVHLVEGGNNGKVPPTAKAPGPFNPEGFGGSI